MREAIEGGGGNRNGRNRKNGKNGDGKKEGWEEWGWAATCPMGDLRA